MSSSKGIVTVIGSGIVGKSWAIVFGRAGYTVHLFDVIPNAAQNALPMILQTAKDLEQYGLLKYSKNAEEVVSRIKPVNSLDEALQGSQWSQECVPEDKESKKNLFQQLDEWVTKEEQAGRTTNIILASSTSAIPASVFTQDLKHKSRCIVAHPINPPHVIPLVEVVPAPWTDLSIVQRAMTFLEQEIAQSPVLIKKEVDSFIVNRLQGALLNEAFRLVEDGYISVDDLDKTMRDGLGLRWSFMGPFETIDMNAPGGVEDYINRYSGNMYSLAQQQSDARKWQGKVAEQVTKERRELLEVDQLGERIKWRNTRLMALMSHKLQQEQNDKKQ